MRQTWVKHAHLPPPNPEGDEVGMEETQSGVVLAGRILFVRVVKQEFSSLIFQGSLITSFCQDAQPALPVIDLAHSQPQYNLLHKR